MEYNAVNPLGSRDLAWAARQTLDRIYNRNSPRPFAFPWDIANLSTDPQTSHSFHTGTVDGLNSSNDRRAAMQNRMDILFGRRANLSNSSTHSSRLSQGTTINQQECQPQSSYLLQSDKTKMETERPDNAYRSSCSDMKAPIPARLPVKLATRGPFQNPATSVSINYLGDPFLSANQSADIADELNTSVWITNLPPDLSYRMLLGSIRNCGKVYATVINKPDAKHTTAASKLVFFDVAGVENLLHQARTGQFFVGGFMPRVCRNRIKTEEKSPCPNSRVLHIEGPSCIVNEIYLTALFESDGITWQNEEVFTLHKSGSLTRLEWRFGSYRCQAESARQLIDRVKKREIAMKANPLWQDVTVYFGIDPCAPQPGKQLPMIPRLDLEGVVQLDG
ncbi:hypothetical protein GGR50DRAFT_680147 [Xylaria sp. CBS 124048]|nr:hypothetical protein GGR50DRAFT_680147 [Xylaria sp. CBS 124048]